MQNALKLAGIGAEIRTEFAVVDKQKAARKTLIDCIARYAAKKMLVDCIARYRRNQSNYNAARNIKRVLPNSFYAHLIEALYQTERRNIKLSEMSYYAYLNLTLAEQDLEGLGNHEKGEEFLREVREIVDDETERNPKDFYEYY